MSTEIILTGSFGVGKSSLFNMFIHNEFNETYHGTIGIRVNTRELDINNSNVSIKLWDIAGEVNQEKVPINYFHNKDVILYIVDLNRPFTFKNIESDLEHLKSVAPKCKIVVVGNKTDLLNDENINEIKKNTSEIKFDWLLSAKTGKNVAELFIYIAKGEVLA